MLPTVKLFVINALSANSVLDVDNTPVVDMFDAVRSLDNVRFEDVNVPYVVEPIFKYRLEGAVI